MSRSTFVGVYRFSAFEMRVIMWLQQKNSSVPEFVNELPISTYTLRDGHVAGPKTRLKCTI